MVPLAIVGVYTHFYWWLTNFEEDEFLYFWVAYVLLAAGCLLSVNIPFGVFAGRKKQRVLLQIYAWVTLILIGTFIFMGITCLNMAIYVSAVWDADQ